VFRYFTYGQCQNVQKRVHRPPGNVMVSDVTACNISGPLRHRYETSLDLVLGVTVLLGDGMVANSGGKVVKNVAGYDLGKLFCGSAGLLGLVVRVSLRLHPLPDASATVVAPPEPARARVVLGSTLVPSALDVHLPERI